MAYIRKRHWVTYYSEKCKMYLRNDFNFECAYCRMKEKDNVMGEQLFEKDHFVSRQSELEWDVNSYENMVYSCCKCNGTKSDQNLEMVLNPCKDDIYDGKDSHIRSLGEEGYYKLYAVTPQGQQFIDDLKLNSRFYRKMRQTQAHNEEIRKTIYQLLEKTSNFQLSGVNQTIKAYLESGSLIDEGSDEFRCGTSKAGEDVYAVLEKMKEKGIKLKTIKDLDINIEIEENGKNAIENACIKAKTYYDITKIPTIGMDNNLFIEELPEEKQPGTHVRRINGKYLTDDEMIEYYTKLVKEYGGKLTAKWVYGMAVYNEKGKKTYTWSKDQFYFVDKPSKKINPGYPLDSITIVPEFNKYLVELTEEEKSKCKKNNNTQEIVSFILDNI